ncbi:MAG: hypothetical protein H0U75_10775 [Legionella sp.]|nr:hypothetical protein [Legionella sp.]
MSNSDSDYRFNPMVYSDSLHTFDKPHFFYWFFQCLVGDSRYFDYYRGDDDSFFANLKYFTKNRILTHHSTVLHMGILDYLLVIPFIIQLGNVVFLKFMEAAENPYFCDDLLKESALIFIIFAACLSLFLHILGSSIVVPVKFILASAILLLATPFLLRYYNHIQQQELSLMQMPVMYVEGDDLLPNFGNELSDESLKTLLDESCGKGDITLKDVLRITSLDAIPTIRPLRSDSRALGVYIKHELIALILPSSRTKEGILAMLKSNRNSISKESLDIPGIKSLLDKPYWKDARTANAFFSLSAGVQQYSTKTGLANVAGGTVPDRLFSEISKYAGLDPVSLKTGDAYSAFFSNYTRAFSSNPMLVDERLSPPNP